jgi:para-aminobenzoate synthetase component 1
MTNYLCKNISLSNRSFETLKRTLSQLDWSVFLESSDQQHVNSQWTIVSADPIATLQIKENDTISPLKSVEKMRHDLFFNQNEAQSQFPFTGGALGTMNYELGYQFETIKNSNKPNSLNLPPAIFGFYDWALLLNHKAGHFFLVVRNHSKTELTLEKAWQTRFDWIMAKSEEKKKASHFKLNSPWSANMSKQAYLDRFEQVQEYILSGDSYQVNLAQRFQATYQGDEYHAYQALLEANNPPFAAFLRYPNQTILSLSPERFLKLEFNLNVRIVESKPIKGTRPRFENADKDDASKQALINSPKDRAENLMIVDLLRNDIGRVCEAGSVKVPLLFEVESFPAVHHLVSTVLGKLAKDYSTEDLLSACFPGGSITGAPKIRSMEIIAELEPDRREIYCGSIGYIDATGKMDMNIAIRSLLCHQQNIYCWAGGGLVADSVGEDEYQECFDKVSRILPVLE